MASTTLEIRRVHKQFGDVPVLHGISLELARGESVAIIGPSGSGKTTLLRIAAGTLAADGGSVRLEGEDVDWAVRKEQGAPPRSDITLVFQDIRLFPNLTGLQNCMLGLANADRAAIRACMERLFIAHCDRKYPREMSHGERQRVAIARALVRRPSILLLDEPTSALDQDTQKAVLNELAAISKHGTSILAASHDWGFVAKFANRGFKLECGELSTIDVGAIRQASQALS